MAPKLLLSQTRRERCTGKPSCWNSRKAVGSQEVRSIQSQCPPKPETGGSHFPSGGPLPAETWRIPDSTLPLLHLLAGNCRLCVSEILPPSTQSRSTDSQKPCTRNSESERKARGWERRKKEGRTPDLTLPQRRKTKRRPPPQKKNPQSLSLPSLCPTDVRHFTYLVTKLWMLIECIKGIITQSWELFCCIFKLPVCLATYSWTRTGKRSRWNKNKGAREGEQAPTWEFGGFPWRKGQLPGARQFGINAIISG